MNRTLNAVAEVTPSFATPALQHDRDAEAERREQREREIARAAAPQFAVAHPVRSTRGSVPDDDAEDHPEHEQAAGADG